ncbi:MAG: sterol desaturase family protein [Candidatus Kapaibacteriales bacterium]
MTKVISNKEETVRLFQNNLLEFLSKVPWWIPMLIYIPTIGYFLLLSFKNIESVYIIIFFFAFGLFWWTLIEYLIHRFVFHYEPKSQIGDKIIFIFHGVHHAYPKDPLRLVMPPSVSVPLAFAFFYFFDLIFPKNLNLPFFAGFVMGYLIYDTIHYAIHHFPMRNKLFYRIKSHHMLHHYKDDRKGFGVSSPLWDSVFNTNFISKT